MAPQQTGDEPQQRAEQDSAPPAPPARTEEPPSPTASTSATRPGPFGGLWTGLFPLALGLMIILMALALQATSALQAAALAIPVFLLGLGLERIGHSLATRPVRAIGIFLLVLSIAGPGFIAASPSGSLDRTTVGAAVPPEAEEAVLRAGLGTGQLRIDPGGPGLFEAELRSSGRSQSSVSTTGQAAVVDLRAPAQQGLLDRNRGADWNVALTPALPWRVEVDAGGLTGDLNLERINVRSARIDAGPSRMALRLGPPSGRTQIDLRMSAGIVDVYLPRDAALELELSGAVVRDFGGQPVQRNGQVWRTPGNPDRAYAIKADIGAGRLRFHWR